MKIPNIVTNASDASGLAAAGTKSDEVNLRVEEGIAEQTFCETKSPG